MTFSRTCIRLARSSAHARNWLSSLQPMHKHSYRVRPKAGNSATRVRHTMSRLGKSRSPRRPTIFKVSPLCGQVSTDEGQMRTYEQCSNCQHDKCALVSRVRRRALIPSPLSGALESAGRALVREVVNGTKRGGELGKAARSRSTGWRSRLRVYVCANVR